MSILRDEDIKRWTVKRKSALVLEILQGKTTVAEANRAYDLPPSELEAWIDAKQGMENAPRANPLDLCEQYERKLKDLQEPMAKPCWSYVSEKNGSPWRTRTANWAIDA